MLTKAYFNFKIYIFFRLTDHLTWELMSPAP